MFSMRVLSLLTCRGKPTEKAKLLAGLVNQEKKQAVKWDNARLRRAVRFILYFSSILPLKFLSDKQDQDVFNKILSLGKYSQTRRGNRNSVLVHELNKQALWNKDKIK